MATTKIRAHRRQSRIVPRKGKAVPLSHLAIAFVVAAGAATAAWYSQKPDANENNSFETRIESCVTGGKQMREGDFSQLKDLYFYGTRQQVAAELSETSISVSFPYKPAGTLFLWGMFQNTSQKIDAYKICFKDGAECVSGRTSTQTDALNILWVTPDKKYKHSFAPVDRLQEPERVRFEAVRECVRATIR